MITGADVRIGLLWTLSTCLLWSLGCEPRDSAQSPGSEASRPGAESAGAPASVAVPQPDLNDMEAQVSERFEETRAAVVAKPQSADAWGRFGMVAHAHELWSEAAVAYRRAQQLDLSDPRWPYFLGDVLSVVGTDLEASAASFRRSLDLKPDYAPAHLRLGKVLIADNKPDDAARELRRALELEPGLQPARLALAQLELGNGALKRSEQLLLEILKAQPRHAQALSTLGQVYMRQGRRDEARGIAERARSAAIYNLYSDPVMAQVVSEGVSSVLIWERAKAFLDNGNYKQAALGLEKVVELLPDNADAHLQLASAYGGVDMPGRARPHLERAIALNGEWADPRVRLAGLLVDQQQPEGAIAQLKKALELDPDHGDARWLLGRSQVLTGDLRSGLETFESAKAAAEAAGREIPVWVHNEWGSALAQTGRPHTALDHFKIALAAEPNNPQSLFYAGLVLEGTGRKEEAIDHYCRSMAAQPNPLAGGRLQALGRVCN